MPQLSSSFIGLPWDPPLGLFRSLGVRQLQCLINYLVHILFLVVLSKQHVIICLSAKSFPK